MIDLGDELSDWDGIPDGEYHPPVDGARWAIEDVFAMRDEQWSTRPVPAPYGGSRVPLNALQKAGFNTEPPPMWRAQRQLKKTQEMLEKLTTWPKPHLPHLSSEEDYAAIQQRINDANPGIGTSARADALGPYTLIGHWIDDEPQDV